MAQPKCVSLWHRLWVIPYVRAPFIGPEIPRPQPTPAARVAGLPGRLDCHAWVPQAQAPCSAWRRALCRAGDGAAQLLQRIAVVGRAAHRSVQAEAIAVGTQRLLEVCLPGHCIL